MMTLYQYHHEPLKRIAVLCLMAVFCLPVSSHALDYQVEVWGSMDETVAY